MPPLVCAASFPEESARRLVSALLALPEEPEAKPHLDMLGIRRFAAVTREDYAPLGREGQLIDIRQNVPGGAQSWVSSL